MSPRHPNVVVCPDGRRVKVARPRGQLFVCAAGCCCGRTAGGFPPVPTELYHSEWERRRLRNTVHLTIGGCLGPCALANVVLLLFDGQALWFHSINSPDLVLALYDHLEAMLEADGCLSPPPALAPYQFTASAWQPPPNGRSPGRASRKKGAGFREGVVPSSIHGPASRISALPGPNRPGRDPERGVAGAGG